MAALSTATAATAATAAPAFLSCIDHIEEGLAGDGYAVLNHAFGAQLSDDRRAEIETMHQNKLLRKATGKKEKNENEMLILRIQYKKVLKHKTSDMRDRQTGYRVLAF